MKSLTGLQSAVAFLSGLLFAVGLGLGGMTQPNKVIGFLDVQNWNPSLIFVMIAAVLIHGSVYPILRRRASPLFDVQWHVPEKKPVSLRLIVGASIFGVGWGLGGFCPGPALVSLVTGKFQVILFLGSMIFGMFSFRQLETLVRIRSELKQKRIQAAMES